MAQDIEKLTRETVSNGGLLAMLYFDIYAKDKESVQQLGTGFINEIIHKPGVVFAIGEIEEPIQSIEGKNWSSTVEVKVLTKDFTSLATICMAHSPYSVEILRPDELKLPLSEVHSLLSTIAAITAEYKKYILTKLAKPEEIADIQQSLKRRADLGKSMLKKDKEV